MPIVVWDNLFLTILQRETPEKRIYIALYVTIRYSVICNIWIPLLKFYNNNFDILKSYFAL